MPTLTIDHLNKSFGETQALRDMTFSVGDGEIFGFVGSNGAGKSTTRRILVVVETLLMFRLSLSVRPFSRLVFESPGFCGGGG